MLVSFALGTIARALGETSEQGKPKPTVAIESTPRLSRTIQRFESLWRDWAECLRVQYRNNEDPELDKLFARTARVMAGSSIIFSNMKMKAKRGKVEMSSGPLVKILRNARKAIVSSQRITHIKELQTWVLTEKPPPGTSPSDTDLQEYERRKRANDKASALVERRKKPVQCCMFVALALFQFLYPDEVHDFVAEYEDEVIRETFNRTISVDDAKTYERLQLKQHCRARLTPPQDKIPRSGMPFGELTCIPRFVRNPMACGAPIVTNQYRVEKADWEYINLNRNNRPQHLGITSPTSHNLSGDESVSTAVEPHTTLSFPISTPWPSMAGAFAMSGTASSPAPETSTTNASPQDTSPQDKSPVPSWARSFRQFGLLFAGAGFLAASVAISRRSVMRRRLDSLPKFYSSNRDPIKFDYSDRSGLAAQALGLATLNVMSFGVMLVGGIGWSFDLSSIEELQTRTRAAIRRPGNLVNPEDEAHMEEMMEELMTRMGMDKPAPPGNEDEGTKKD
ncbi:hypothetical protein G7Z17_g9770 [Cylindrodendrum hubeiense]|uniref:Altered inheritance of mitochondria protein 11 n=1 Tax=Cylindrodendrum hubeiense TaxID=595255 RepID=A0A9P5LDB9_9HYPO|nr:hypothetical protein G7Z17_g9770 [Cylindrodendrum hubeiense]